MSNRIIFVTFLVLSVFAIFGWNFPVTRDMTYRFRHGIAENVKSLSVTYMRDDAPERTTEFFYQDRGAGRGPASQDHGVRLRPGRYLVKFDFKYRPDDFKGFEVWLDVRRFSLDYTLDIDQKDRIY